MAVVAREQLIAALAVEQDLHSGGARQPNHTILGIHARPAKGLLLVPEKLLVIVDELRAGGEDVGGSHATALDDGANVLALVDARIVEGRVEHLELGADLGAAALVEESVGDTDDARGIQPPAQAKAHAHVAAQPKADRIDHQVTDAVYVALLERAVGGVRRRDGVQLPVRPASRLAFEGNNQRLAGAQRTDVGKEGLVSVV